MGSPAANLLGQTPYYKIILLDSIKESLTQISRVYQIIHLIHTLADFTGPGRCILTNLKARRIVYNLIRFSPKYGADIAERARLRMAAQLNENHMIIATLIRPSVNRMQIRPIN